MCARARFAKLWRHGCGEFEAHPCSAYLQLTAAGLTDGKWQRPIRAPATATGIRQLVRVKGVEGHLRNLRLPKNHQLPHEADPHRRVSATAHSRTCARWRISAVSARAIAAAGALSQPALLSAGYSWRSRGLPRSRHAGGDTRLASLARHSGTDAPTRAVSLPDLSRCIRCCACNRRGVDRPLPNGGRATDRANGVAARGDAVPCPWATALGEATTWRG
jgi:hypothetical protein